jgi:type II secretory pathway predicted ATPase ExeA
MMRALRRSKDPLAAPPYLSRYKLRESPFANGARFFYADPERAQTLNMLQHLTQYSEELLLVNGPAGSGKSALLEQYLTRADEDWKVCRVSAVETPDPGQLFLSAARCFGLSTDAVAGDALLDALRQHLNQLQQTMTPVLVVDDADRLSDDALEIVVHLAELPGDHGKLVRVILFADSALLPRFDSARFASGPRPHRLDLKPLDEAQTIAYLQHRLATAGFAGGPLFQPRDLKRILKQSQGWPGGINLQAHEVLMSKRKGGSTLPWTYLAAALAVAAGAGAWLQFSGSGLPFANGAPTPVPPPPPPAVPERPIVRYTGAASAAQTALVVRGGETVQITCVAPAAAEPLTSLPPPLLREVTPPAAVLPEPVPAESPAEAVAVPAQPAPAPIEAAPPAMQSMTTPAPSEPVSTASPAEPVPSVTEAPVAESVAAASPGPAPMAEPAPVQAAPALPAPVVERIEPDPVPGSRQAQTLTLHGRHFTPDSQVTVSWRGQRKTLAATQVRVLDSERIAIEITTGITPATWSVAVANRDDQLSPPLQFKVAAAVPAAPAPAPAPTLPAASGFRDAAWLWAQNPRHVTVQLVGASTEEAVRAHLRGYDVDGDLALIASRRDDKPWFVLFWGRFADRAAAERAVAALPAPLKRVSPWIRPFADVHGDLAAAGIGR